MTISGRRSACRAWAPQQEVLRRGGRVGDADVALRAQRQEALEAGGGVLRTGSLVAMGQQQGQARSLPPLGKAGDDELVDDDLGPA